jgi:alkylation response protein AidB-like acyl-CoA dehydrogenase
MTADADPVARARSLAPLILEHADAAERARRMPAEVAQAMARLRLYRIATPERCGGEAVDPMRQIETIEAVAAVDGSCAWNLMIGIENHGLIQPNFEHCAELLADPMTLLCSSTAAVGTADEVDGGWRVSGRWPFVSGCHNAQVFAGLIQRRRDGTAVAHRPAVYAVVPAPHFEILDTWNVGGLCGSGSHDVVVHDVFVPHERVLVRMGQRPPESALERFPIGSRLAYNKVGVALGIGRAAIDAFVDLATGKIPRFTSTTLRERPFAQRALGKAEARLRAARSLVFELTEAMWQRAVAAEPIELKERALYQIACSDAASAAAEAVELVCEAAGTSANERGGPLERRARDIRVVRQHVTVAPHHIEDGGRVLLGLPPTGIMLADSRR